MTTRTSSSQDTERYPGEHRDLLQKLNGILRDTAKTLGPNGRLTILVEDAIREGGVTRLRVLADLFRVNRNLTGTTVLPSQEQTLYNTALSEFSRIAVTSTATGAANEAFLYSGPIDGLTRPFCLERVGRVFSRAAIDAMDNGQLDNVFLTGGGLNCRHTWLPVPPGDDMEALAGTGRYVEPEYEQDVKDAEAARERLKAEELKKQGHSPR